MFNLDDYEDVQSRVKRFHEAFPMGRIIVDVITHNAEKGQILVAASVYRDDEAQLPAGVDIAFGDVATYNPKMRRFYAEDTATSAVGRAISLILDSEKKPTRQDMVRVSAATTEDFDSFIGDKPDGTTHIAEAVKNVVKAMSVEPSDEAKKDITCIHGQMNKKTGISKTGRPYYGWVCREKGSKCPPRWLSWSDSTHRWFKPDGYYDFSQDLIDLANAEI